MRSGRWLALALVACRSVQPPPLAVTATAGPPVHHVDQIVEQGDLTYVFATDAITIARGGVVTTVVPLTFETSPPARVWSSAASIPALDGASLGTDGRWIVATRFDGTLWRVTLGGELEPIGDRFALGGGRIDAIGAAGKTFALGLDRAIGVSTDGVHVARYPATGELAVARDRLAVATATSVDLWDLARGTSRSFAIHGHPAFLDPTGAPRLVVTTGDAVWLETAGKLAPLLRAAAPIAAVAGTRLWIDTAGALYVFDGRALARTDAHVDGAAALFGSPSGDLWANGRDLRRYSVARSTAGDPRWTAEVAPVFARVCAHCHLPGGDADVDLSTVERWTAERGEIARRVLDTRTMPPAGTPLTDDDRRALADWLAR